MVMTSVLEEHLTRYDKRISQLDGWFTRADAHAMAIIDGVQKQLSVSGDMLEIGVYKGKSFIYLQGLLASDEVIIGLDIFGEVGGEKYLEAFLQNLTQTPGAERNCVVLSGNSRTVSDHPLPVRPLRLAHIDGDHEHDGVLNDLQVAYALMQPRGGVVCLDDLPVREFPGIWSALCDFIYLREGQDLRPFLITRNKGYLSRKADVVTFRNACAPHFENVAYRQVMDVHVAVVDSASLRGQASRPVQVFPR